LNVYKVMNSFKTGDLVVVLHEPKYIYVITKIICFEDDDIFQVKVINDVKRGLNCVELVSGYQIQRL